MSFISYFSPPSTYYSSAFNLENHTLTNTTHQGDSLKNRPLIKCTPLTKSTTIPFLSVEKIQSLTVTEARKALQQVVQGDASNQCRSSRYNSLSASWFWVQLLYICHLKSDFISFPCVIPISAVDEAQGRKTIGHLWKAWSCWWRYRARPLLDDVSGIRLYSWQQATGYNPQFSNFKKFQNQPPEFQPPPIKFGQVSVFRW